MNRPLHVGALGAPDGLEALEGLVLALRRGTARPVHQHRDQPGAGPPPRRVAALDALILTPTQSREDISR